MAIDLDARVVARHLEVGVLGAGVRRRRICRRGKS